MSILLSEDRLKKTVRDQSFIKNGSENCVEGSKYDFRLGKKILKASFRRPVNFDDLIGDYTDYLYKLKTAC